MTRTSVYALTLATALALPASAAAQNETMEQTTTRESDLNDQRARGAYRLGLEYYRQGRFAEAAAEFERAYGLSGRGDLLFNAYLAFRDAQDEVNAARSLRGYLAHATTVPDREHLEARLAALEGQLAREQQEEEAHRAATEEAQRRAEQAQRQAEEAEQRAREAALPRYRDVPGEVWPWAVLGVGGAMIIGGAITGGVALAERDALVAECDGLNLCEPGTNVSGRRGTVEALAITTDVLLIGGGVAAVAGLVFGIVLGPHREEIPPGSVTAACTNQGCFMNVRGDF